MEYLKRIRNTKHFIKTQTMSGETCVYCLDNETDTRVIEQEWIRACQCKSKCHKICLGEYARYITGDGKPLKCSVCMQAFKTDNHSLQYKLMVAFETCMCFLIVLLCNAIWRLTTVCVYAIRCWIISSLLFYIITDMCFLFDGITANISIIGLILLKSFVYCITGITSDRDHQIQEKLVFPVLFIGAIFGRLVGKCAFSFYQPNVPVYISTFAGEILFWILWFKLKRQFTRCKIKAMTQANIIPYQEENK